MTKVSVLLPTFNRPKWLVEAVHSVLSQDVDLDLVILDNGSGEETVAALREVRDPRIYPLRFDENHQDLAYRTPIQFASGEYVVLFTDDDRMLPGNLAEKARFLDENPDCGFVYSAVEAIGEDGEPNGMTDGSHLVQFNELFRHNAINMPSVMMRRELMPSLDGLAGFAALSDWALWLELAHVSRAGFIDKPLVQIRLHGNTSSNATADTFQALHYAIWSHWIERGHAPSDEDWGAMRLANLALADQQFARFKTEKEAR